jgi:hypothetical protein
VQAATLMPLHEPPQVVPAAAQAGRVPTGAPVTGEQVPPSPGRLHAWHCPAHAAEQQTPSAQNPDAHTLVELHGAPSASLGTHCAEPLQ